MYGRKEVTIMKRIGKNIKNYLYFIKESQSFMKGCGHPVVIFLKSLFKGIRFCIEQNTYEEMVNKFGSEEAYVRLNRIVEF